MDSIKFGFFYFPFSYKIDQINKKSFIISLGHRLMKRQKLLKLLDTYQAKDHQQALYKNKITSFVNGNSHCFDSHHPPAQGKEPQEEIGHITGSAWVLSPDKKAILLTHHKKLNKWLQLGGHSDGESDVIRTAMREAQEESGIQEIQTLSHDIFDVDIHIFPKKKNIAAHLHYDIRFCFQAKSFDFIISEESHNLKWIPLKEITKNHFEESIVRMALKTEDFLNRTPY